MVSVVTANFFVRFMYCVHNRRCYLHSEEIVIGNFFLSQFYLFLLIFPKS